ncbi:MAG: AAA family ATPase [Oscillatoriales cyanobacterium SM2_1_8]|nr:AAA family ATPase [Oscillatoriales cyanobacterium SM2_1_8]
MFAAELRLVLRARYPILGLLALEEERAEQAIATVAKELGRAVYLWDFVEGYQANPTDSGFAKRNPLQALELIDKVPQGAVFILRDFDRFWEDLAIARKLKNLYRRLQSEPQNLILLGPDLQVPPSLREMISLLTFPLPTAAEIQQEMARLAPTLPAALQVELTRAAQGLSLDRVRRVMARGLAERGELNADDIEALLAEKRETLRQTQILDFFPATTEMDDIGGLDNLKEWLLRRGQGFAEKARQYGLPYPKGLLLAGIQGTGKSLTAKAIAHRWHLPLLRLDAGRLFGGLVGESEGRTRQAIQLAEALAPCVLWIDEIDKAFAGARGQGDGGTSARVLATLLTWMAEKTSPVFVVATANDVQQLPPELLRKGRFDEIFFVGLPDRRDRAQIFQVHLTKYRPRSWHTYDIERLAAETPDFSGAEIEQAIVEAMHFGFSQNRDFTTEDILVAASEVVPLSKTAQVEIERLQAWAAAGKARLAARSSLKFGDRP